MTGIAKPGAAGQQRAVFAVDEDAALAALEETWADGGNHAFGVDDELLVGDQQRRGGAHRIHAG